jgi:hypothetical protein
MVERCLIAKLANNAEDCSSPTKANKQFQASVAHANLKGVPNAKCAMQNSPQSAWIGFLWTLAEDPEWLQWAAWMAASIPSRPGNAAR